MCSLEAVVQECASRFSALAAGPLLAARGRRLPPDLLTGFPKTRVGGSRPCVSGQPPRQRRKRPINTLGWRAGGCKIVSGRGEWNEQDPNYLTFAGGDPINSFDSDGRQDLDQYEIQIENNQVRTWTPAGQQQYQNETTEQAIENGDFQAYNQGQQERAATTTAVALPVMGVASVAALPAGPEGEAITWNVIGGAMIRGAAVNAAASATVADVSGQPVGAAIVGGGIAGGITGPLASYAQTLSPFASVVVNSAAGFVGNYAGNASSQIYQNGGLNNYDPNQSLFAGTLGAILNPAEANVSATSEGYLPQTPLFKAAQVSLDYGIGVGDSSFGSFLDQQSPNSESQQPAPAYTPGPLGGKH